MQYYLKFPELAVSVAEDRMTGIPSLLMARPETEVVLLDDAYQHRSVKPGLNILITDYASPFYQDYILPYGRLREGRSASKRADIIVVSKCPAALNKAQAEQMIRAIKPLPAQQVFFSTIRYGQAYDFFGRLPAQYAQRKVLLISGIAKPEPLVAHISQTAEQVHLLDYPDHHFFTERNFEEIRQVLKDWNNDCVIVTTEKDATRLYLHKKQMAGIPVSVVVLPVEVSILLGQQTQFDNLVRTFVAEQQEKFVAAD